MKRHIGSLILAVALIPLAGNAQFYNGGTFNNANQHTGASPRPQNSQPANGGVNQAAQNLLDAAARLKNEAAQSALQRQSNDNLNRALLSSANQQAYANQLSQANGDRAKELEAKIQYLNNQIGQIGLTGNGSDSDIYRIAILSDQANKLRSELNALPNPERDRQQRALQAQQQAQQKAAQQQLEAEQKALKQQQAADLKQIKIEQGIIKDAFAKAQKSASDRLEDELSAAEQRGYWARASNRIWDNNSKDPWADFRRKLEAFETSADGGFSDADRERYSNTPSYQSQRPVVLDNGRITTREEQTRIGDEEYLRLIKSKNAKH